MNEKHELKSVSLGKGHLKVPIVGYGCLQLEYSGLIDESQVNFIVEAYKLGVRFFDTAAAYGQDRHNEIILGKALKVITELKGEAPVIATKCGIAFDPTEPYISSEEEIRASVELSLKNLGVDCIDLLYLHRVDPKMTRANFEQVMSIFRALVAEGKIKHVGLSECSAERIRAANKIVDITSVELAYSLFTRRAELNGVFETCQELGIGLVAYTSVVRGATNTAMQRITDEELDNSTSSDLQSLVFRLLGIQDELTQSVGFFSEKHIRTNSQALIAFQKIAVVQGVSPSQLALAWLGHRGVVSIPGTTNLKHLAENVKAMELNISSEVLDKLTVEFYPGRFQGNPNPSQLDFLDDDALGI